MTGCDADRLLRWAEIVAVGSELLVPPRIDTNSLFMTTCLNDVGIEVRAKTIVADRRDDLADVLRGALQRVPLVVICGGLGPTDDDLTRDAVAGVLGLPMVEDAGVLAGIRARFARRAIPMPDVNRRQALVPAGAVVLDNEHGTAPGLWIECDGHMIVLLPGPPNELNPMFARVVAERLAPRTGGYQLCRRTLTMCGRTESEVEQAVQPTYSQWLNEPLPIATTVLTAPGQIELHLSVHAATADAGAVRLDSAVAQLVAVLGDDVFSLAGEALEVVVGRALVARGWRIAVAESCTGGLISSRLTDAPGSSAYVVANLVCYDNAAKTRWVGVPADVIEAHGAVSEAVAAAMADGIRRTMGVDLGIGVTGIAGPLGGSDRKPVGTVVIAVATAEGHVVRTYQFPGGRTRVKFFASQMALDMVRRVLTGAEPPWAFVVAPPVGGQA